MPSQQKSYHFHHVLGFMKNSLLRLINATGYRIEKIPKGLRVTGPQPGYERVSVGVVYAPWRMDAEFQNVFQKIRNHTLVDEYRCYELWQLLQEVRSTQGAFLEVGVWKGGTGALIAEKARLEKIPDPVFLADTFTGVVKASEIDLTYQGGEHADVSFSQVTEFLHQTMQLENIHLLKGIFPDETARQIPPGTTFRFCHIDVDVYKSTSDVMDWISKRMAPGGVVVIDDYGFITCNGVTQFVDQELRGKEDHRVVHNLNGHAIVIKIK